MTVQRDVAYRVVMADQHAPPNTEAVTSVEDATSTNGSADADTDTDTDHCPRCKFPLRYHDEPVCEAVGYLHELALTVLDEVPSAQNMPDVMRRTIKGGINAQANIIRERVFRSGRTRDREPR